MIQYIDSVTKELDISKKKLKNISLVETKVDKDTTVQIKTDDKIDNDSIQGFSKEVKLNNLTTILVKVENTDLNIKLEFKNRQTIYWREDKAWRRQYRNGWVRFWHFDWKKDRILRFDVHNSNDLLEVVETRVIEIKD